MTQLVGDTCVSERTPAPAPPVSLDPDAPAWRDAFLIRAFEERLLTLFSEGKLFGTVHTCIGQEFTGVAVAQHLRSDDVVLSNHRCHGHYLARTRDVQGLMAEVMGRVTGVCGGRGGSQHICAHNVYSNGVQGGMTAIGAGMALAQKQSRSSNIVVIFIGDGTLGEGLAYEAMNITSKWELPVLFALENNLYAQSTSQSQTLAGDICARAEAFGIRTYQASTDDPASLIECVGEAVKYVRAGKPAFARLDTARLKAHSKGDDYRPEEEMAGYRAADPLHRFLDACPEQAAIYKANAESAVQEAVVSALSQPFGDNGSHSAARRSAPVWKATEIEGRERVVNRIHAAMRSYLSTDPRALLIGEDIEGPYGGAFKVTKDLSSQFVDRVKNTPISEAAITGIGTGLALAGMRPVCEIMFGDFMTLAADQFINHAAKFRWMYNDQVAVPTIIRTPMGGRRGYGATHSQSLEKHFLGVPDTWVLAIHPRIDPYVIYRSLFLIIDRPTVVIENKVMYGEYVTHETVAGFAVEHTEDDFPTTRISNGSATPDVTVVCYGGCLVEAERAIDKLFEDHEVIAEIICPTQLYPLNLAPILDSVRKSGKLLVVEEGQGFCGFGAEVIAEVTEAMASVQTQVIARRVFAKAHPLASGRQAEADSLPDAADVVAAALEMTRHG